MVGFSLYSSFLRAISGAGAKEAESPRTLEAATNPQGLGCKSPSENPTLVTPFQAYVGVGWGGNAGRLLMELWGEGGGGDLPHQLGPVEWIVRTSHPGDDCPI